MRLSIDCGIATNGNKQVSKRYCMLQKTWYGKSIEFRALNIILIESRMVITHAFKYWTRPSIRLDKILIICYIAKNTGISVNLF